ncbi:MAG: BlaI/MecI/CopY family transcriptional regulator [Spirochaetes bacterium]|nr:BlaI/MecI/CopY family transcriptional regulator [Spirochaetota bacterium]
MLSISPNDFEILKLLWKHKQLSGREIHNMMSEKTGWAYSTTRTTVERMVGKELVKKGNFHGLNVYIPAVSKVRAFALQVSQFAEKILERDALAVLPLFTKSATLSDEEIKELKALLRSDKETLK